jgi:FHA domain
MHDREAARRPVHTPLRQRSRRRWAIAGCVAVGWLVAERITGSFVTAAIVLVVLAGLGVASVAGLRAMGITWDHPAVRRIAARPWRDGQDVLNVALRHLSDVFIVTPNGSVIAPDVVELQMTPGDLATLCGGWQELDMISASATEVYEAQAAKRGARFAGASRPEVYIVPDDSLAQGRYRLRRGLPEGARYSSRQWEPPEAAAPPVSPTVMDGKVTVMGGKATVMDGMATVMEQVRPAVPVLRLVTGSSVSETVMSGARAGRGAVELVLPNVRTVSREHARFTFAQGGWWVTNQGMNRLCVNGVPVSGDQPLSDGDTIRWGTNPDAPQSRVEIG